MFKYILTVICGVALVVSLVGCSSSQNNTNHSQSSGKSLSSQPSAKKDSSASGALSIAFQDELNGFTTIEQDVKKGDYSSAKQTADQLHNEFHAEILPPLKAKKGNTYAENIHSKYDELQDAVSSKDPTKIAQLIKVNRDNLNTVAKILGVSIK